MFETVSEMTMQPEYGTLLIAGKFDGLRMGKAFYLYAKFQGSHKIDDSAFFCPDNIRICPGRDG